jgi:hypothetical protein
VNIPHSEPAASTPPADEPPGGETGPLLSPTQRDQLRAALQPVMEQVQKQARDALEPQLEAMRARVQACATELTAELRAAMGAKREKLLVQPESRPEPTTARREGAPPPAGPARRPLGRAQAMWQHPVFGPLKSVLGPPPVRVPARLIPPRPRTHREPK